MSRPLSELSDALSLMLDRIDLHLRQGEYSGEPIKMYLAGGMALHFYSGARYTEDVDASFSHRLLLPGNDLAVDYVREDGSASTLYFDVNYNDHFGLMHPDYRADALEWVDIGNPKRLIHLYVLKPVDLAVSKVSRFSPQDRTDILLLARQGHFTVGELRKRAVEAMDYYVGDTRWIRINLDDIAADLAIE